MIWTVFFIISLLIFSVSLILALLKSKAKYKIGRIIDPLRILLVGATLSSIFLFIPICINAYKATDAGIFESVIFAIYKTIGLFILEGDIDFINSNSNI